MANADRVAMILAELQASEPAGGGLADRLVRIGREAMDVTGVGLSVMTSDAAPSAVLAATDGQAGAIEELQFSLGEGPCVESVRTGRPVLHGDLALTGSSLWPGFTAGALDVGVAAVFAFPLQVGAITLGAMDFSRDAVGPLTDVDVREAMALAGAATAVLLHLQLNSGPGEVHVDLADSLVDRAVVHQATGMIAIQIEADLADALTVLRARAFADGRPIVEVARDVVARNLRFSHDHR
ncbi:ANTAR domain-containing protein [Friedmanniella luteola]|uniref:ANTAR domain-containing protein n=1 Tax=Friedmanniella luteola TaxID=546871 RepID=A0A1H1VE73_9ACTN|nr:GAF and ANTAR domain-containing protein [Friedmanniella luteola]SDS83052.1 ANTAR domain-containing protein [Friedmanniella luteola]